MSFARLIGQKNIKIRLISELKGDPYHASVFSGPKGIGKHEFSREYAKALLCSDPGEDGACDRCNNCRYFDAGSHPDLVKIEPDGSSKNIKVEVIRNKVVSDVQICPQIALRKVYLIDADLLNEEGQNALLKSLEEPPENIKFVMTCEDTARLLPTVMSRCEEYRLRAYSNDEVMSYLKANVKEDVTDEKLKFAAEFSSGVLGRAEDILTDTTFSDLRDEMTDLVLNIGSESYTKVLYGRGGYFDANQAHKDELFLLIMWILGDLDILLKDRKSDKIMNKDIRDKLCAFLDSHPKISVMNIYKASGHVTDLKKRLELNINFSFAVSDMLLGLKKELT